MAGIAMAGGGADAQAGSPPCARHRARPALRVRHDGPVRGSRNERAGALQLAARSGPPGLLRDALDRALVEMRAGVPQAVAIRLLARRSGSTLAAHWAVAMAQAEALGASLGPVLRTLAAHGRDDRRIRAEQMALQAPVKMLLPLIGCIFPAPSSCWPFLSWCSCRGACLDTPGAADGAAPAAAGGWLVGADAGLAWRKPRARGWASCSRRVSRCIPSACAIP